MRRFFLLLILCSVVCLYSQGQAKYVFYFIGDGMGVNQVNAAEMYNAELDGNIGVKPFLFTTFPVASFATTYSVSNGVTDSAAGGTALATGSKTKNGAIGVDSTLVSNLTSVAEKAKAKGMKVGVTTSVSIDHATPASFYAHQASRNMNYEIAQDLVLSGFDFFGGSGFVKPETRYDKTPAPSIYPVMEQAGYSFAYGYEDYLANAKNNDKVILVNNKDADNHNLTYAIDRENDELTLAQITEAAVKTLSKDNNQGFFVMVEGGQIDWACHANDAATVFREIADMDEAVKVAYNFYLAHPDETLIVVTADHETGGIVLGTGRSALNLNVLQYQKVSKGKLSSYIRALRNKTNHQANWEEVKELLAEYVGLWKSVPVSEAQEKAIYNAYKNSFVDGDTKQEKSLYQSDEKLAAVAIKVLNEIAMIGWSSGSHSAGYVPVFAIGAGADLFKGKMDNTEIPNKIGQAANF